jgi:hypothetical protein
MNRAAARGKPILRLLAFLTITALLKKNTGVQEFKSSGCSRTPFKKKPQDRRR